MSSIFQAFAKDRRGSLAIMTAICSIALMAVLSAAVDYAMMMRIQGQLQAAADAAALASAREMNLAGATDAQIRAVATAFVRSNFGQDVSSAQAPTTTDMDFDVDVEVIREKGAVEIAIRKRWTPFLLYFLGRDTTSIKVSARAQTWRRLACVVGLSPITPPGVQLWNDARLTADGCDVYSNTDVPAGLVVSDGATLEADLICAAGGYVAVSPQAVSPDPLTDCPAYDDPLASREAPEAGPCDHIATVIINQNKSLDPGVYCGGLTILGNSDVTLNPGIYFIQNGPLKVAGSASMTGENTGFYLSGLVALLYFDSDSTIDLTAPKDGPLAGILFFEDHNAPPLRVHRIGSNNARNLLGTIYLPVGILLVDANAPVADNSAYTAIVARSLQLREGPNLVLNSDYKSTDVPVPDGLFTGKIVLTE